MKLIKDFDKANIIHDADKTFALTTIDHPPLFQRSWMKNTTYLEVNLYLRMFHPLTTTGVAPILILIILNVRITTGIQNLQNKAKTLLKRNEVNTTCTSNNLIGNAKKPSK